MLNVAKIHCLKHQTDHVFTVDVAVLILFLGEKLTGSNRNLEIRFHDFVFCFESFCVVQLSATETAKNKVPACRPPSDDLFLQKF